MDELDELREELVGVRAEAERLAEQLADREAQAQEMAEGMESLRLGMEAARTDALRAREAALEESRRLTDRYRAVLLQMLPDVPPDLIRGDSADDLDRSAAAAREMLARTREHLQAEAAARIPAGSPARGMPEIGSLSAAEKIRLGIQARE